MSYTCRIFSNTGFNATNRPDKPSLLNSCSYTDLASMDILQDGELNSIRVNASYAQIKNADYAKVGDWYYSIIGRHMENPDTCTLALLPDYTLSAGGVASLTYLDGITERVHVAKSSDTFGAYAEDDPLTAPSQPLEINSETIKFNQSFYTVLESAIDLIATAASTDALTYTDPTGEVVTVPNYSSLSAYTDHLYGGTHKTASYVMQDPTGGAPSVIQKGIDRARALGVESAIIGQYNVPTAFMGTVTPGFQQRLVGDQQSNNTSLLFVQYPSVNNMRVNYGDYTKYGMLTAGGNKAEYKAEDIYNSGDTSPRVITKPDIRKDGCPYHRFQYYLGDSSADGFWQNCVAGAPWEQVPIVYSEKSSNALDRLQHDAEVRKRHPFKSAYNDMNLGGYAGNAANFLFSAAPPMGGGNPANRNIGNLTSAISQTYNDMTRFYDRIPVLNNIFENEELNALRYASGQVVAPDIQFPYNTDIMRDALGNGVIVYRYGYTVADVARIDKLLTMYGYRVTKPLEVSDFTNRSKFNFVRANNVSVGGLPKWWADGIAAELATGIRFWHVLPDTSIYTSGQN